MSCYDGQIVVSLSTSSHFVALRTGHLTWGDGSKSTTNMSSKKPAVAVTNELLLASATSNSTVSEEQRDTSSFLHELHGLCKPEAQGYMDHRDLGPLRLKTDKFLGESPLTPNTNQWIPCQAANSWCWWCHCHAGGQCHIHPNEFAWSPGAPLHKSQST